MKRLHAIIEGHVQGVGFRDFVAKHARQFHLVGWVSNLANGDVEVLAEGEDLALNRLVMLLERGSAYSQVADVHTEYAAPSGEFTDFQVRG